MFRPKTSLATRILWYVSMWMRLRATRRQLAQLSDESLHDIGLSREQANFEAMRPFWDGGTSPDTRHPSLR
ncbi:DUF1127 domain-containing protein [Breoghania sp. L-A4]|uniref:DUF1127 domain-containing protein n=1 Tax=Breoghania sp. L-A4 TaxID=2304600 RepID=UPI0020BE1736|nr:DUF1127 domain-containing protein [Breoghania sp. L-A4]